MVILVANPVHAVGDISIDKNDGVYHIILSGEKVKKELNL